MKILTLTQDKNFSGGSNRSFFMVISGLKKNYGFEIEVLLPGKGELQKKLEELKIPYDIHWFKGVVSAYQNDGKDWIRKIKVPIMYYWEVILGKYLAKKYKNKGYELVYTNSRLPIVGAIIAKELKIPHVCHMREFGTPNPIWGKWAYKDMYEYCDRIILISQSLYNWVSREIPQDKLVMIHNAIDGDMNLPQHELFEDGRFNMLLAGRLVPDKGHEDAIRALKILKENEVKNAHLYFAGSAPESGTLDWYTQKLKNLIHELDLDNDVTFLGEVRDMIKLRSTMDIELMCAICETFGRVTVEGMRNGLLVIGSNTGGTPEIILDGENGLLYEQGNPESLAKILEYVYNHKAESKNIADKGYAFSQKTFLPEKNIEAVYSVLNSVCKK